MFTHIFFQNMINMISPHVPCFYDILKGVRASGFWILFVEIFVHCVVSRCKTSHCVYTMYILYCAVQNIYHRILDRIFFYYQKCMSPRHVHMHSVVACYNKEIQRLGTLLYMNTSFFSIFRKYGNGKKYNG